MPISKQQALLEISRELNLFFPSIVDAVRCPTCMRDLPMNSAEITEEHIIPESVSQNIQKSKQITTILCKRCNSNFGAKQTRWLGEWIELLEGGHVFNLNPKKQRLGIQTKSGRLNSTAKLSEDGTLEFHTALNTEGNRKSANGYKMNNPELVKEYKSMQKSEISIQVEIPVVQNEHLVKVGFLTAAYGLWFKYWGYSFIFQECMDIVREQIINPEKKIMNWNYLLPQDCRKLERPRISITKFGKSYFPTALVYDRLVILPSPLERQPIAPPQNLIEESNQPLGNEISNRWQSRCLGPSSLVCAGREIVLPNKYHRQTGKVKFAWVDGF